MVGMTAHSSACASAASQTASDGRERNSSTKIDTYSIGRVLPHSVVPTERDKAPRLERQHVDFGRRLDRRLLGRREIAVAGGDRGERAPVVDGRTEPRQRLAM